MVVYYQQYQEHFQEIIRTALLDYDIDLIMYDETEYFRQYNHPLFNYPYTPRKTLLNSAKFNLEFNNSDYAFDNQVIKLQKTVSCLEPHYIDQINFIGDFGNVI